ncbi:hypothetical protein EYR40_004142 [Pleurotus pulmonarius]|nr:hypothetical protein EYR40_004142 [Pleurotus pulmonarius]KAF4606845.1 hypothetical protein EYR38_000900 [Pleurotus pulmonarius]
MSFESHPAFMNFQPTPASIPPRNVVLRQVTPKDKPVYLHNLNPLAFLLRAAQIYPNKMAIAHPDTKHPVFYPFSVWCQRVQNLAYALIQADAHFGFLAARCVFTPINIRLKPSEVEYIIEHSGSKLILCDREYLHLIAGISVPVIICDDTGKPDDPYEQFLAKGREFSGERSWQGLEAEPDENAASTLCYTSGTTGRPKGVVSTLRGAYLAAIGNAFESQINRDSTYLWILPMFHAAGWTYPWATVFAFATQITLRTVDYSLIWNHFLHSGVTHYCGAPTVQIGIFNHPKAKKLDRVITAIIAGSAPTAHLIGELEKIGIKPCHVYGLTSKLMARQGQTFATAEVARVVYQPDPDLPLDKVVLVDVPKDGKTIGEIVTKGNIVMKEYLNDPEATKKAFRGGYFNTGDLAVMHPDGSIAIMDRSKDIIISGGENASSLAIEQELASHPHVLEVSVVARSHPKWGERPMAFVILHPQHAEKWAGRHAEFERDLKEHAKQRLPGFACPEWVEVVPDLPKTSTGKILKTELRKRVNNMKAKL